MTGKRCLVALLAVVAIGGLAAATPKSSDANAAPHRAGFTANADSETATAPRDGCACLGDINQDHFVDVSDIGEIDDNPLTPIPPGFVCCLLDVCTDPVADCRCADIDGNGKVDGRDIPGFVEALLQAPIPNRGACCLSGGTCVDMSPTCCDAAGGAFAGVGSSCEPLEDCNGNGVSDVCDILGGASEDCNGNQVPDECDVLPQTLYAVDGGSLYTVNPTTGACQLVANLNPNWGSARCLTVHPMTTELYAVLSGGHPIQYRLAKIDKQTAAVELIGGATDALDDIAFRADGTLFGVDHYTGAIVIVNTEDGTTTATPCSVNGSSVAFCPGSDLLYYHVSSTPSHIETIDLATCTIQSVGGTCNLSRVFECMTFTPVGNDLLLFSNNPSNGSLYQAPVTACNPTCNLTLVGSTCGQQITGMTYAPFSADCNHDGIPDECQVPYYPGRCESGLCTGPSCLPDCNHNCIPDDCEDPVCGACCHLATGECVAPEGQEYCNGPSDRFIEGGTCNQFHPLCGNGACCLTSGACLRDMTQQDCQAHPLYLSWHLGAECPGFGGGGIPEVACAPIPDNDDCEDAELLEGTCVTVSFNTTSATPDVLGTPAYWTVACLEGETAGETDDDVQVVNNIWYKYQIPTMYDSWPVTYGQVVISTVGSEFDTVLAVWGQIGNTAGCGDTGAIDCTTLSLATEIACNDDIVAPTYSEHDRVQASYVRVDVSDYDWDRMWPGACIYIMVGGADRPGFPAGGAGQLNLDFFPLSYPWNDVTSGVCCTATGCFIAEGWGDCEAAGGYLRAWTDFYEDGSSPPDPFSGAPNEGSRAGSCCHGEFGSCQEGEYCGKAIDLGTTPNGTTMWEDDVHRVTYFKFTPRDLIVPEEEYYLTIDTCGSEFDTVLSVYSDALVQDWRTGNHGECDILNPIDRNDNCVQGQSGATSLASCYNLPGETDSCLCLKVEGGDGLLSGVTYYIGVGKKDTRPDADPFFHREEGIDPVPNYPIDNAVGLKVTIKDTWTDCGS